MFMIKNAAIYSRTKRIDIRLHFIGDSESGKMVNIQYYNNHDQLADVLTKVLVKEKFIHFKTLFAVCNFKSLGSVETNLK